MGWARLGQVRVKVALVRNMRDLDNLAGLEFGLDCLI